LVEASSATKRGQLHCYLASLLALGRMRLAGLLALVALGSFTEVFGIVLIVPMLGFLFSGPQQSAPLPILGNLEPWLGQFTGNKLLFAMLGLFLALMALRAIVAWQRDFRLMRLSGELVDSWRLRLVGALSAASWRQLQSLRNSRVEHAILSETNRLSTGSDRLLRGLIALLQLLILIWLAIAMSPALSAITVGVFMLAAPLILPAIRLAHDHGAQITRDGSKKHNLFSEFLAGMKLAKVHDAEPRYLADYAEANRTMRERGLQFAGSQLRGQGLFQLFGGLAAAGVVVAGIVLVPTPPSVLAAFLVLLARLIGPLLQLAQGAQGILSMLPAVGELLEIEQALHSGQAKPEIPAPTTAPSGAARVEFAGLSFSPVGREKAVLSAISGVIEAGEIAVLLGPSGSGKTTLADIVLGLIEPDQGDIRFDGAATTGAQRRAQTAYVPQEAFLFDRTIRENLQWVCPEADDDALWQALDRAAAAPFVRALPQGLDTPAGNRGERFSGGERQRLCLARALLLRPRLLILDEATSALDPEVEARLLDTLAQLRGSVTVLAIAHRLPPAFKPDRTFRLSGGALHQVG
jgi:ATP-binding cassette, subfamily C, bacterial